MDFNDIQNAVANWINRDDLTATIPTMINIVQMQIERVYHLKYREKQKVWSANTLDILSLPTDYDKSIYCFVTDTNGRYRPLTKMTPLAAYNLYPSVSQFTGRPEVFAAINALTQLVLRPYPDQAYDITLDYFSLSPALVNGTDTNWLTLNAYDALIYGACLEFGPFLQDQTLLPVWEAKLDKAMNSIAACEKEEETAGSYQRVQPYGLHVTGYGDII
jgi:hypothetical protein